jgi:hypothetical protein
MVHGQHHQCGRIGEIHNPGDIGADHGIADRPKGDLVPFLFGVERARSPDLLGDILDRTNQITGATLALQRLCQGLDMADFTILPDDPVGDPHHLVLVDRLKMLALRIKLVLGVEEVFPGLAANLSETGFKPEYLTGFGVPEASLAPHIEVPDAGL